MCYSYENKYPDLIEEILSQVGFSLGEKPKIKFAKDVKPTNQVPTLLKKEEVYHLISTTWGIQFNPKSPMIFNSRIETIKEKPFWKKLFEYNRALLPMTGFYEWTGKKGQKIKHKIALPDEEYFVVPALYHEKEGIIYSSLVTVPPNEFMTDIHHRMPAILRPKDTLKLMDADIDSAIEMCKPYKGEMQIVDCISK